MLLRGAGNRTTRENLNGLFHGGDLVGPQLLALGESTRLLLTCSGEVRQVLRVVVASRGGVLQIALRVRRSLQRLGFGLRLLSASLRRLVDLGLEVLGKHFERMPSIHLLLLEFSTLILELRTE